MYFLYFNKRIVNTYINTCKKCIIMVNLILVIYWNINNLASSNNYLPRYCVARRGMYFWLTLKSQLHTQLLLKQNLSKYFNYGSVLENELNYIHSMFVAEETINENNLPLDTIWKKNMIFLNDKLNYLFMYFFVLKNPISLYSNFEEFHRTNFFVIMLHNCRLKIISKWIECVYKINWLQRKTDYCDQIQSDS